MFIYSLCFHLKTLQFNNAECSIDFFLVGKKSSRVCTDYSDNCCYLTRRQKNRIYTKNNLQYDSWIRRVLSNANRAVATSWCAEIAPEIRAPWQNKLNMWFQTCHSTKLNCGYAVDPHRMYPTVPLWYRGVWIQNNYDQVSLGDSKVTVWNPWLTESIS